MLSGGQVEWVETRFIAMLYKKWYQDIKVLSQIMWKSGFFEKLFCENIATRITF